MFKFIEQLIPSLILFSSLFWHSVELPPAYSESFADSGNFLTLKFTPGRGRNIERFSARWTTDQTEFLVQGERRLVEKKVLYVMDLPEGRFVGSLGRSSQGCEPVLHFTVEKEGSLLRYGKLRGAFCL